MSLPRAGLAAKRCRRGIPFVATIDRLRIHTMQLPHAGRKVPFRCLDEQMVVVGHKSVRVADPVLLLDGVIENGKEQLTIPVGQEDVLLRITP